MFKRQNNNAAYYVSIIIIILFWGCSVEQTHKSLTYFFDGVDKAIFFNSYLSTDSLSKDAIARREGLLKKVRPDLCVHQPFKEKKCDKCHTPDKRLLMPMPGLCYQCHKNFTETYANVHGPVASGNCVKCHNQHSSKYPKLLTRQGQQVCTFCHSPALVFANRVHKDIEDAECTLCHNPHGGKTRFMVKANIPKDANRIALMSELTSRHLYAQIFCKDPGDINSSMEIKIYDNDGKLIATAHPDNNGKFILSNLHPDQNYTFKFKNTVPDCRINVMDSKGTLLYVIERKKGKYTFDKAAYEATHEALNSANEGGGYPDKTPVTVNTDQRTVKDTAERKNVVVPDNVAEVINTAEKPADNRLQDTARGRVEVKELPGNETAEETAERMKKADTTRSKETTEKITDTATYKRKIVVKEIAGNETPEEIAARNKKENALREKETEVLKPDTTVYKGKIVVKELPGDATVKQTAAQKKEQSARDKEDAGIKQDTATYKGKIVVKSLPDGSGDKAKETGHENNTGAPTTKYELNHMKLAELAAQINNLYEGTTVCVLDDSADYIDIASVNNKGQFLLFDFLSYRVSIPEKNSGVVSQTIFLNKKMELIEVVNKRISNGRYVYVSNSKEPPEQRVAVKLYAAKENASLFTTIYYEPGKAAISPAGIVELGKVVEYLNGHPAAKAYLAAHTDTRGSAVYNQRLSEGRSKAAVDYLLSQGINRKRISGKAYGKTKPVEDYGQRPGMEEALQKNRRVEVYIKDK